MTRIRTAWLGAALIGVLAAGCTSSGSPATSASSPSTTQSQGTAWPVVALGDSVPAGTACDCTPYPQLSASDLSVPGVREISADNLAVEGYTSEDVKRQVMQDAQVVDAVKRSYAIEVQVGANDVGHSRTCGTTVECYATEIPQLEQNLRTIVRRIHELTAGHPALVILLDYWSVWLGGQYA
ncbi:MAG TPA: SGNH/GDSL hydrolase family protein, partial [Actinomycetales bacterium]|nr:SGNH/GDSL hydrolase family protein [Actinomycetales bacterium]